jgi:hypothetical protein
LASECGISVYEERQDLPAFLVVEDALPRSGLALDYGIDRFEMGRIGC